MNLNLYPRSFMGMLVLGNILIALPLLIAVGYASLTVDDLSLRSEETVRQASEAATLSYALQEDLAHMEQILRQYEVLHDPSLLEEYATERKEWHESSEKYMGIPLFAALAGKLGALRNLEKTAWDNLPKTGDGLARLKATLTTIDRDLHPLLDDANRRLVAERETFRLRAQTVRQRLLAALLTAIGLTAVLLALGRRSVARLWSRFERAVLALGEGRLERSIQLKGPDDLQRVGSRLEWLRRRMLMLESERTRIMRHATHELKTPLATLREGAALLKEGVAGPLTPQQTKIAGIMQTNALRLQNLIDGVLRMQQASHAREHMDTSIVRLDQLIEQTLASLQLAARNRRLRITGTLAPLSIQGSAEALATIANNLISNAIKFSPDDGTVNVTLSSADNHAVLDIVDDGPGISAKDRLRIFEPFYRGSAGKGVPGVGLGLAIAHEFTLAHRGRLEIIDREQGAHFRVSLPLTGLPT